MSRAAAWAGVLLALAPLLAAAGTEHGRRDTLAGSLVVTAIEGGPSPRYRVSLGGRTVLEADEAQPAPGAPMPEIRAGFRAPLPPFDEVVVMQQQMLGNACNGGPLWLIGIRRDGGFAVSDLIDFCGGPDPVIRLEPPRLRITLPGGPPNRGPGPRIPAETWLFEGGHLRQVR